MEPMPVNTSELNLKALWESLKCLVKPATSNEAEEFKDLREAFQLNLRRAVSALGFEDSKKVPGRGSSERFGCNVIWDFVETALFILTSLKERLQNDDLSVSQQKDVRSCVQFVVSLGIQPNVLPGIILNVSENSALEELLKEDATNVMQKYDRLCVVVKALLGCCDSPNFRSIIISNVIHQLLGALFQLSYAPVKKPSLEKKEHSCDIGNQGFEMTPEIWERIHDDKQYFRMLLHQLVKETFQPKIMFELMVLQGERKEHSPPLWLKKSSSSLLTTCLIQPGGVAALVHATFDSSPDTGSDWKKMDTLTKIITSPANHYVSIAAQLLQLLQILAEGSHDRHLIAVACVRQLLEKDAPTCHKLIIQPLLQPLTDALSIKNCTLNKGYVLLPEDMMNRMIKIIHLCFASSCSKVSSPCLPGKILFPFSSFFFKLFSKVHGSVSTLCKPSEDILYHIFCDCNALELTKNLKCILLGINEENVHVLPEHIDFNFGPSGGVSLEVCPEAPKEMFSSNIEDYGNMLMILLEKKNDGELSILVFEVLLRILVELGMKPKSTTHDLSTLGTCEDTLAALMLSSEKHIGIVRLLAALVESSNLKEKLAEKPGPILTFIVSLFDTVAQENCLEGAEEDEDLECVFVAFMILNVILDKCDENTDWSVFANLLKPVSIIKDRSKNEELTRLASRVYNIVSASGALHENVLNDCRESKKTKCEEALHDACDPLLPVRAHALVQLTKLLQQRDKETFAKKEAVLCLFKENLNNSDSYIYLAAINGMVALAAVQSDDVVKSLTNEYIEITNAGENSSRDPELRMKLGEILVKLVGALGGMAPKYKNELLNAFLIGTKDIDHLMRASSLSNLGEVCQMLGFRVGSILRELLLCIQSILKFDKAVEPRRAAVMVVTLLLRGLEASTLNTLQDAALELYRNLKSVYCNDEDDVVRLHAQLALEELGRLAQDFLFPKLPMAKKIQMLP